MRCTFCEKSVQNTSGDYANLNDNEAHFMRRIGQEYTRGLAKSQIIITHTFRAGAENDSGGTGVSLVETFS